MSIDGEIRPHNVDLVARLCVLDKRKRELKQELDAIDKEIEKAKAAVLADFQETGNQRVQYGDRSVFLNCQYFPDIKDKRKLLQLMRENGMEDLITEQPARTALYHVIKDWMEAATAEMPDEELATYDLRDAIPEPFHEVLSISEKWTVKTCPAGRIRRFSRIPGLNDSPDDEPF